MVYIEIAPRQQQFHVAPDMQQPKQHHQYTTSMDITNMCYKRIQSLIQNQLQHMYSYRSVHDNTPLYLSDLLQKHNPSRLLRSASRSLLDVPGPRDSKTKRYGQRAFRYVAPSLWNVLPESIKEKDSIQSFRPSLKTHFFTQG